MPKAEEAISWAQTWSRYNRKEIVNAVLEALPKLGSDVAGPLIGTVPEEWGPDFARVILERLAHGHPATTEKDQEAGTRDYTSAYVYKDQATPPKK